MSLVRPSGSLTWVASTSPDVVGYRVFQSPDGTPLDYSSPAADVGNVTTVELPVAGLPAVEGSVIFGVASVDGVGNVSDIFQIPAVLIDVTPPTPPTDVVYAPFS